VKAVIRIKINFGQEINNQTHLFPIKCTATTQPFITHSKYFEIIIFILLYLTVTVDIKNAYNRIEISTLIEYQL